MSSKEVTERFMDLLANQPAANNYDATQAYLMEMHRVYADSVIVAADLKVRIANQTIAVVRDRKNDVMLGRYTSTEYLRDYVTSINPMHRGEYEKVTGLQELAMQVMKNYQTLISAFKTERLA